MDLFVTLSGLIQFKMIPVVLIAMLLIFKIIKETVQYSLVVSMREAF